MSKKIIKDNIRVEVFADCGWRANPNYRRTGETALQQRERIASELYGTCSSIRDGISRHVDDVGHCSVVYDHVPVCEHCGADWTEDSPDYNGGCCRVDIEAEEAREAALAGASEQQSTSLPE